MTYNSSTLGHLIFMKSFKEKDNYINQQESMLDNLKMDKSMGKESMFIEAR